MSSDSGKPPLSRGHAGSSPGRPAADTPQRVIVTDSSALGASDTAVALASDSAPGDAAAVAPTYTGIPALGEIIGTTLSGRYLVTKKVGQGGMGAVYEATHTLIGKRVAVKVLLEKYAQREAIVARLKQEAQLASSIGNEHIIDITDIGNTEDGRTFVVMEYLEGESLAECLSREHQLPEQRILRIASQAASALGAAHAKGIVHRDIKPENLFLLKRKDQDFVKVVDFGISKSLRATGEQEEAQRLTQTGMVLGTPLYMSPEQARGDEDLDARVDIYALGVIMYEAAVGHVPFAGTNYLSVISQVLSEDPKPLRELRPDMSEELEAIVMRAMEKQRGDRYSDAEAMLKDITAVLEDPTHSTERAKITGPRRRFTKPKIPRMAWAVGGIGLAVGAVMLVVVMLMGSGKSTTKQTGNVPPSHAGDAGTMLPAVVPDAAGEPEVAKITLHIVTDPPNATLYKESEPIGGSPQDLELVMRNKEVQITAVLDGFNDGVVNVNPLEHKDGQTILVRLKKLPKGAKLPPHQPGTGSGAGSAHTSHGAGDLNGYPGNVPSK